MSENLCNSALRSSARAALLALAAVHRDRGRRTERGEAALLTPPSLGQPADRRSVWCARGYCSPLTRGLRQGRCRGVEGARIAPGPMPVKGTAALRVVTPLFGMSVADRTNWTIARLRAEIETREGVRISRSQLSKALRKKSSVGGGPGTR